MDNHGSIYIYVSIYLYFISLYLYMLISVYIPQNRVLLGLTGAAPWPGIRKPGGVSDASWALGRLRNGIDSSPREAERLGKTENMGKIILEMMVSILFWRLQSMSMWTDMIQVGVMALTGSEVKASHCPVPWRTGTGPSVWRCGTGWFMFEVYTLWICI
jgi:hypothetical protein